MKKDIFATPEAEEMCTDVYEGWEAPDVTIVDDGHLLFTGRTGGDYHGAFLEAIKRNTAPPLLNVTAANSSLFE